MKNACYCAVKHMWRRIIGVLTVVINQAVCNVSVSSMSHVGCDVLL